MTLQLWTKFWCLTFLLKITIVNKDIDKHQSTNTWSLYPNHSGRQVTWKKLREILKFNDAIHQMYLTYLQNILSKHQRMYFIFSIPWKIFPWKIGHILGHKTKLTKFRKVKITQCILSDHNLIKLNSK